MAFARKLYEEAIELSPEYASTYRLLGWTYIHDVYFGWSESPGKSLQQAEEFANRALSLGDNEVYGLFIMIYTMKDEYEKAIAVGKKGLAINPNSATYRAVFATALCTMGRNEEALVLMKKAMRLNPHHESWYLYVLGRTYSNMEQYNESIPLFKNF
jgi:adenylate cyclase